MSCVCPTQLTLKNLFQVLDEVASAGSTASVTRRSAGLPLIVQSIIAGESKTKQVDLLQNPELP